MQAFRPLPPLSRNLSSSSTPHITAGPASISPPQRTARKMSHQQQQQSRGPVAPSAATAGATISPAQLRSLPFPPHPELVGSQPGSFAEGTIKQRLPAILGTVLADLDRLAASPSFADSAAVENRRQLETAVSAVKELQQEMPADARLVPLRAPEGAPELLRAVVEWTNAGVEVWQRRGEEVGGCLRGQGV